MSILFSKCPILSASLVIPTWLSLIAIATLAPTAALACDPNKHPFPNCSGLKKIDQPISPRSRTKINPTPAQSQGSPTQDTVCGPGCMTETGEVRIDSPTPAQSLRDARIKRRQKLTKPIKHEAL
jgi:hypothetical protein